MVNVSRANPAPINRLPARVQSKLEQTADGCWLWLGYVDPTGRPLVSYHGMPRSARRMVYEFLTDTILASTEPVSPTCGNSLCLNPGHQKVGGLRNQTPETTPQFGQAIHICARFGGEHRMAKLLGVTPSTCYRWSYPPPHGTGGLIPHKHISKIKSLARFYGVLLSESDWAPRAKELRP